MKPTGAVLKVPAPRPFKLHSPSDTRKKQPKVSELRRRRDRLHRDGKVNQALTLAKRLVEVSPSRESYFKLGVLLNASGDPRQAIRAFRDALRFSDGPRYLLPEIQLHKAHSWYQLGHHRWMREALRRAYSMRPKPRTAPNFNLSLGSYYFSKGKYREALVEFERAEESFTTAYGRGKAAANRGFSHYRLGNLDEALKHLDRAIAIQKRLGSKIDLGLTRTMRAAVLFDKGQTLRAYSILNYAARDYRIAGDRNREAEALQNAGYLAGELGNFTRSHAYQSRAIRLASQSGHPRILARAHACRALAAAYLEDFQQSTNDIAKAKRVLKGGRNWPALLHVCRAEARIAALLENWPAACRLARRGERLAAKVGDTPRVAEFRKLRALAEEKRGRSRKALFAKKGALRLEGLLSGESEAMRGVVRAATKLSRSRVPVLIAGEAGTGKTELAKRIHKAGSRADGPCVVVPCELLTFPESDLAGHSQGAWSGARQKETGYIRQAQGGTLILDRVEELSAADQRVLLRMVEGWIRPVGETKEQPVDVRVIATTEHPTRLIPALRSRLEGALLRLPPLRERAEDISVLTQEFLKAERKITGDALATLARQRWEGNIPELKSSLERMVRYSKEIIGVKTVQRILNPPKSRQHRVRVDKERHLRQMASLLA